MNRQLHKNKGFTLVELLICMAILSIVMLMVVQFMSTTTMAQRKTKYNLQAQSEASEIMGDMENIMQQASYVRVEVYDDSFYTVDKTDSLDASKRSATVSAIPLTTDLNDKITYDLVPDNYANYIKKELDDSGNQTGDREVIIDFDNFKICTGKKAATAAYYPLAGDLDDSTSTNVVTDVRSFRLLKQNDVYYYVKPEYIYVEYTSKDASGKSILSNIIYRFSQNADGSYSIYVKRSDDGTDIGKYTANRYETAKNGVNLLSTTDSEGRLTKHIQDYYLSADAEGNALLIDSVLGVKGYKYHTVNTVKFRNSNILAVRPQNMYKVSGTGGKTGK